MGRLDESHRVTLDQERADLDATRAALPGWHVWHIWHCGQRTWHAVPAHLVGPAGPTARYSTQPRADGHTSNTRSGLIRQCGEARP
jgi:hypothetical protein